MLNKYKGKVVLGLVGRITTVNSMIFNFHSLLVTNGTVVFELLVFVIDGVYTTVDSTKDKGLG